MVECNPIKKTSARQLQAEGIGSNFHRLSDKSCLEMVTKGDGPITTRFTRLLQHIAPWKINVENLNR